MLGIGQIVLVLEKENSTTPFGSIIGVSAVIERRIKIDLADTYRLTFVSEFFIEPSIDTRHVYLHAVLVLITMGLSIIMMAAMMIDNDDGDDDGDTNRNDIRVQ